METTKTHPEPKPLRSQLLHAAVMIAAVGICALAISAQSLWIDEARTADKALQPSPEAWWQKMVSVGGADLQMPLYMAYVWGWDQTVAHGEWFLRAANLPWLALGLLAIPRRRLVFMGMVVSSPFLWFYVNEARPYAMQIGAGLLILGALWHLAEEGKVSSEERPGEGLRVVGFCLGLVVLCGSSLTGMIWAGGGVPIAVAVLGGSAARRLARRHWPIILVAAILMLALAAFFFWALKSGVPEIAGSTGMGTALFAGYELLGFEGLGPGRLDLSAGGLTSFRRYIIPLAVYAVFFVPVFIAGCKRIVRETPRRVWLGCGGVLAAIVVLLVAADALTHFRVLDFYAAPLAPAFAMILAAGAGGLWKRGGWRRLVPIVVAGLTLASAASIRLAHRHAKDDYQNVAAAARTAVSRGERVWWFADRIAASYYEVPLSPVKEAAGDGQVWAPENPTDPMLAAQPLPSLVVLSKPDLFDRQGAVRGYLAREHFFIVRRFPAFTLWRKSL